MSTSYVHGDDTHTWRVFCEPISQVDYTGGHGATEEHGLSVSITNGAETHFINAVAFNRRASTHRRTSFKAQLQVELDTAAAACQALNDVEAAVAAARGKGEERKQKILEVATSTA